VYARLDVELRHAQLHLALIGAEEQDPVEAVPGAEPDHAPVERAALVETVGEDVGLDSLDGHDD
jgi:hypothetical protein